MITLAARPDPGPLSRTILRLRHDLVTIGRAGIAAAGILRSGLAEPLTRVASRRAIFSMTSAVALNGGTRPPPLDGYEAALSPIRWSSRRSAAKA